MKTPWRTESNISSWTYGRRRAGKFIRVRRGPTNSIKESSDQQMLHNIDLHAVTGTRWRCREFVHGAGP